MQPPLAPPPPAGKRPNRRVRLWIAMGAGILALLCLGGVGVFISVYDQATEIKRTAPRAVVNDFLAAYLLNKDDASAELYLCKSGADMSALDAYRRTMETVAKDKSVGITVTWSDLTDDTVNKGGSVSAKIQQTASDNSRLENTWRFDMVDQDGWRICSATKIQ
jgi:hypothetical protein